MSSDRKKNDMGSSDMPKGLPSSGGDGGPPVSSGNQPNPPTQHWQPTPATKNNAQTGTDFEAQKGKLKPKWPEFLKDGTARGKHPSAKNEAAKRHFARLQALDLDLDEVPFHYWEPALPSETRGEHNLRRQIESKKMDTWLEEQEMNRPKSDDSEDEEHKSILADNSILLTQASELKKQLRMRTDEIDALKNTILCQSNELESLRSKHAPSKHANADSNTLLKKNLGKVEQLMKELSEEKKARENLEALLREEREKRRKLEAKLKKPEEPQQPACQTTINTQQNRSGGITDNSAMSELRMEIESLKIGLYDLNKKLDANWLTTPQKISTPLSENNAAEADPFVFPKPRRNKSNSKRKPKVHPSESTGNPSGIPAEEPPPTGGIPSRERAFSQTLQQNKKRKKTRFPIPSSGNSKLSKILLLPKNGEETAVSTLQSSGVPARNYGIRNIVQFGESGAALVTLQADKIEILRKNAQELGLREKRPLTTRNSRFTVHDIPADMSEDEVKSDIAAALGSEPLAVTLVPYKQKQNSKFAAIECSASLLEKAKNRSKVLIGYTRCRVDTSIQVMRCSNCHLIGQTRRNCKGVPDNIVCGPDTCPDCRVYNLQRPEHLRRNTAHKQLSHSCRTYKALIKKYLSARKPAAEPDAPLGPSDHQDGATHHPPD